MSFFLLSSDLYTYSVIYGMFSFQLILHCHVFSRIFGAEGEDAENNLYVNWLNMLWCGAAKALEMYSPASKSWLQVGVSSTTSDYYNL